MRAVGDRAGHPAMRNKGSWQSGTEDAVLRCAQGKMIWLLPFLVREANLVPAGLTFHDPLAIFTIKLLLQCRLVLSRTSFLFP